MADKVFVSPGVYTSERDLTFVTRQVGVTTLGLVGETTKGPAFQPIFVSNYDEFTSFFGGLNATKIKDTGAIIPGHGGILDRIDGMIFALPFAYVFFLNFNF